MSWRCDATNRHAINSRILKKSPGGVVASLLRTVKGRVNCSYQRDGLLVGLEANVPLRPKDHNSFDQSIKNPCPPFVVGAPPGSRNIPKL